MPYNHWYCNFLLSTATYRISLSRLCFPHKHARMAAFSLPCLPSSIYCSLIPWYNPLSTRLQRSRMTNWWADERIALVSSCLVLRRNRATSTRTEIPWDSSVDDRAQFGSNCWRCVAKNICMRDTRTRGRAHLQGTPLALGNTLRHGRIIRKICLKKMESKRAEESAKAKQTFTAQPSRQTDDCQGSSVSDGSICGNRTIIHRIIYRVSIERSTIKSDHIIASYFQFYQPFLLLCVRVYLGKYLNTRIESNLLTHIVIERAVHPHPFEIPQFSITCFLFVWIFFFYCAALPN